jgi:hypothetical protein
MTRPLGLACLMSLAWAVDASALCSVPRFFVPDNQTADAYMTVSSGDQCTIRLRHSSGPNHRTAIVQRPSNGSAVTGVPNNVTYRSRAGYVGSDVFTYSWSGLSRNNSPVVNTVRVNVKVVAR